MSTSESFASHVWDQVRLPRFDTGLSYADVPWDDWKVCWDRQSLLHSLGDHVPRNDEPWAEVLGDSFVKAIREMLHSGRLNSANAPCVLTGLDRMGDEVRRCSARPRLIQMYVRKTSQPDMRWLKRWLLLLPSGWLLILERQSMGVADVVTLYFHRAACRERIRDLRWRRVLNDLVITRYGNYAEAAGRHFLSRNIEISDPHTGRIREQHVQVELFSPEAWGFVPGDPPQWHASTIVGDDYDQLDKPLRPRHVLDRREGGGQSHQNEETQP